MHRQRWLQRAIVVASLVCVTAPVKAQDRSDVLAYYALLSTPAGALPTSSHGMDVRAEGSGGELLYGRLPTEEGQLRSYGLEFGTSGLRQRLRWAATGGVMTCNGCELGIVMLGLGAEALLAHHDTPAGVVAISAQPALGAGLPTAGADEGVAFSGSLGLPISLSAGDRWRATVFVTPGIAVSKYTELSVQGAEGHATIGGGVRFRNAAGIGALVGVRRVMIERGGTMVGIGISLGS